VSVSSVSSVAVVFAAATFVLGGLDASVIEQSTASQTNAEWCEQSGSSSGRERFCEVREFTIAKPSELRITDSPNGSIQVTGSSRPDVVIRARVVATAATEADARALAGRVQIETSDGQVRTDGPRTRDRESWQVSYRVQTPTRTDLELEASNGSVSVSGVNGRIRAESSNGSIRFADLAGDVSGRSSNGSVHVTLSGTRWEGSGLDVRTSNGSAQVEIPDNYNAHLVTGTSNGSLSVDFPVTVTGRISRRIDTDLGSGGATIRVESSNGSVRIGRR
jgi:DUF4097 and DUF4098 domain-containing protein YvlB